MISVFRNGPVFLGGGSILENGMVIARDGKIVTVRDGNDASIPDGAILFNLEGHMLFPGFIDCHVHLCSDGSPNPSEAVSRVSPPVLTLMIAEAARKTVMAGVTTIRDAGGKDHLELGVRDAIKNGLIPGPRILASGRLVCMTGGHGWQIGGREADGPDEVRKAVREQIKAGCDVVKLMATGGVITEGVEPGSPQLTLEELRAGVEAAHKAGRRAGIHAQGNEGIKNGLQAGIDILDHGVFLDQESIDMMLEQGTFLIPTLSAPVNILREGDESLVPDFILNKTRPIKEAHFKSIAMAREAGVAIGMGTDIGTPLNRHGENLNELVYMAELGFSPEEALISATSGAARALGITEETGTIEEGKAADLVMVRGNPLEDIRLLADPESIRVVVADGTIVKTPNAGPCRF